MGMCDLAQPAELPQFVETIHIYVCVGVHKSGFILGGGHKSFAPLLSHRFSY